MQARFVRIVLPIGRADAAVNTAAGPQKRQTNLNTGLAESPELSVKIGQIADRRDQGPDDAQQQPQFTGLHVLVAEDNLVNQKLVASMLKRTGHVAKVVENGQLAVEEIRKGDASYDLILM